MRILLVVVTGLVGWLWFATRAADPPPAPRPTPVRRADLSALQAQIAATGNMRSAAIEVDAIEVDAIEVELPPIEPELFIDGEPVDDARDADLFALVAQLEAAQDRATTETIVISDGEPVIDTNALEDYTVYIPEGRTFEGVLGAAAGSQGQEYGVSFSSNCTVENTYIIVDEPYERDVHVPLEGFTDEGY